MEMPNRHERRKAEAMSGKNGGRIQLPNSVQIGINHTPMPLVHHQAVAIPVPGGISIQSLGGIDVMTWLVGCWIQSGKTIDGEDAISRAEQTMRSIQNRANKTKQDVEEKTAEVAPVEPTTSPIITE